ncbi:MAG: PilZ domain-containing protein [Nitrosomonadales bacterium]|nr:PilZ domain-containing protein [Nitrosomonadales bacterium]
MENKRSHPREPARVKARLMVDDQSHDCVITNSSSMGVRLYLRVSVPTGKAVRIRIAGFGEYDATVVWCDGDETGLQFEHEPAEVVKLLAALAS